MLLAENQLMWREMAAKIHEASQDQLPQWVSKYADFNGEVNFKKALAKYMEKYWLRHKVNIDHIAIQAGCGAILESLFWTLADEGDSVILPGPVYPNFFVDGYLRAAVNIEVAKTSWEDDFTFTFEML